MNRRTTEGAAREKTRVTLASSSSRNRLQIPPEDEQRLGRIDSIKQRYIALLRRYLRERREEVLLDVYRLGREAIVNEMGLLGVAELHHEALQDARADDAIDELQQEHYELAGVVLAEFLSAHEMTNRGYREASTAMRHLNEMLEDEVRRIAHAIHDGAGQYLACVHISLYSIAKHTSEEGKEEIRHAHELLEELEKDLRRVSHELRPRVLENSGLSGAIDFLVDNVTKRTGLKIHVDNKLSQRPAVVVETALYRCVQEMLNNVVKHARANNVWISLEDSNGEVRCEVRDDGVGFDASEVVVRDGGHQLGFLGIQERLAVLGGSVEVESQRGKGVRIVITVPA